MTWRAMSARAYPQVTGITGIKITMVRFALEQGFDFLRISQGGVAIPQLRGWSTGDSSYVFNGTFNDTFNDLFNGTFNDTFNDPFNDTFNDLPQLPGTFYNNGTGVSSNNFAGLPAQLQVPFTLGPGDVTLDFTSDGRGLHSSTLHVCSSP